MARTITACLIARDEEERLPAALQSVAFCDEVIVVDSGSRDRTRELARAAGARVLEHEWAGFAAQRNFAIGNATSDWVLEIDADERVSPALAAEIRAFLDAPPNGFELAALPLYHLFLGGRLGPSGKYPLYVHRMFRRGAVSHPEGRAVHEGIVPTLPVWAFEGDLEHIYAASWREAWRDTLSYSKLEASLLAGRRGAASYLTGVFLRPAAKFAYRMVADGGWRDGWRGAAFVGLSCVYDAAVWMRVLRARGGDDAGQAASQGHFGRAPENAGPVRIAAVARGGRASQRALDWLERAGAAGADAVLLSDCLPTRNGSPRVRHVPRLGPLTLLRELDAESRVRPFDAVVGIGPLERQLLALVPRDIVPRRLDQRLDPAEAERRAREESRSGQVGEGSEP